MLKKLFKNRIFLCVFTALIVGTTSVYAVTYFPSNQVTYDNKTSGLKSSDVQGAIDELYSTCSSSMAAGDYLYYSVNNYGVNGTASNGYNLYRCNSNGDSCTMINSSNHDEGIGSIYSTGDYLYYSVNNYTGNGTRVNGYKLYRCNLNGDSCTMINSSNSYASIDSIYSTGDYLYYSVNNYSANGTAVNGYRLYRCNSNGDSCTMINSSNSDRKIVS